MISTEILLCSLSSFLFSRPSFSRTNAEVIVNQLSAVRCTWLLPPAGLERHDSTGQTDCIDHVFNAINRLRASDLFSTLQQKYRAVIINSTISSRTTAVTVGAAGSVGTDKKQSSQFHESSLINRWFHSVPVMPAHYTEPETFYWPLIGLCSLNEWKIKERNIPLYKCAYVYIKIISENRLLLLQIYITAERRSFFVFGNFCFRLEMVKHFFCFLRNWTQKRPWTVKHIIQPHLPRFKNLNHELVDWTQLGPDSQLSALNKFRFIHKLSKPNFVFFFFSCRVKQDH